VSDSAAGLRSHPDVEPDAEPEAERSASTREGREPGSGEPERSDRGERSLGVRLRAERTPNPHSVKWLFSVPLASDGRGACFESEPPPGVSPLAARLFSVPGVTGVFIARDFVTVSKDERIPWPSLAEPLLDALKAFAESGEPALGPDRADGPAAQANDAVEARIQRILDEEIRPYVAQDGGDVVFAGFREGRVQLYLQGSCSGCPSSLATLKLGIEGRLREAVPEVQEVVAI
jgi:Fe-S cluster biogenesis protein NfuA